MLLQGQKTQDIVKILQTKAINVSEKNIQEILATWYKREYVLIKNASMLDDVLIAQVGFSEYPFTKNTPPCISSNLINVAVDQCGMVRLGLAIKDEVLCAPVLVGGEKMTYSKYIAALDEFLCADIHSKYLKPIPPVFSNNVEVQTIFTKMHRASNGRYFFRFKCISEFFITDLWLSYPIHMEYMYASSEK